MKLAWHAWGKPQNPALVLLHGGHGSHQHWARNVAALAQHYHVLAPDMPGYGDSDTPPKPTMESLVDTLQASLNELTGKDAPLRLVGFSFGGLVAAQLAAVRPHITHLSLLGPAGHGTTRRPIGKLRNWNAAFETRDDKALQDIMRHNLRMHMLASDAAIDAAALKIHTNACLQTRFHSKKISRSDGLLAALNAARQISPHMVLRALWGAHDVTCTPHDVWNALLPLGLDAQQSHIVPNVGHWVQYEAAAVTNAFLLKNASL